jgi:hypothetical protein
MSGANGIFQQLVTTKRNRKVICGSFTTANTSAPTSQVGDLAVTRTGTGAFAITLSKKFATCECVIAQIDGYLYKCNSVYTASTGVIAVTVAALATGTATDTTSAIVQWIAVMSDRSG